MIRTTTLGITSACLVISLLLSGCSQTPTREEQAPTPPADPAVAAETGLKLVVEPFTDFYFLVRAQAAGVVAAEPELQPIIDAWMPVQKEIGTFGGFWRFDLAGLDSRSPGDFRDWFAEAPETVPSRRGGTIPIRGPGLAMAEAMERAWPRFHQDRWPERRASLEEVVGRLEREFMPKHRQALRHMLESLGIPDLEIEVPTHLVLEIHPPGAGTYRARNGPIAVLSINELINEGRFSDLEETILHETCHALDLASKGDGDVFTVLRRMLEERGVDERDRRLHDIPHLVMFAQAENTMRRLYDPDHVAYGDTWRGDIAPFYERSGEAAVVVRKYWSDYLDGTISREQALAGIADLVEE